MTRVRAIIRPAAGVPLFKGSKTAGYLLVLILLLSWELLLRLDRIDGRYLPSVTSICTTLYHLVVTLEIVRHSLISLKRIILGFLLGGFTGYVLGFACGCIPRLYATLELTIEVLRPMPSIAIVPIAIIFLGLGDALNVAVIGWACSWPVFVNTMDGVRGVDRTLVVTARTFGVSRWEMVRRVLIPASLPTVFTGLRVSLGIAVAVVVVTEMVASGSGLGFLIVSYSYSCKIPEMYAGIVVVSLLGYGLSRGFTLLESYLIGWRVGMARRK